MAELTIFQRLRDAAVRRDGIQMKKDEVEELFDSMGEELFDRARVDDHDGWASGKHDDPEEGTDG